MKRRRLTREESREQTQQRLLDAALRVIARKGLAATSVEDIAAQAGYTRGAFYSNFRGKHDLFIELLRRDHQQSHAGMNALLAGGLPPGQLEQQLKQFYSQMYQDNECFMNWTEARLLAARDAKFRTRLNALVLEKRDAIAGFIVQFCERLSLPPPAPPAQMAMGFMSLVEGVRLFRLSSPQEMAPEAAESILALFLEAVISVGKLRAA
jgi:AcrR family transcriptional regulator